MIRTSPALSLSLFVLVALSTPLGAADQQWTPEPFEATPEEVFAAADGLDLVTEDADVAVMLEEVVYRHDAQGRETRIRTVVYRLLTEAGVDGWQTVSSSWEPWHEERPVIEARVLTPDGKAVVLDPGTISEAPDASSGANVFDDNRLLEAPLPAAHAGVIVEERATVTETEPRFPGGTKHSFYPWWSVPVHHTRLVIEIDDSLELRWKAYLLEDVDPVIEAIEGARRFVFDFHRPEEPEDAEPNLPFDHPRYPHVAFSTGKSWAELAGAYSRVVEAQIAAADPSVFPARPSSEPESRQAVVAAALAWVHDQVRYAGLEFGRSSIVPYTPDVTVSRGYGDCKDQATLLVALLRRWGVWADVAMLRAGLGFDTDPELPGLGAFNHVIVVIPGETPLWIDPTSRYHRVDSIPLTDAGRLALVANPSTKALLMTPSPRSEDSGELEWRVFELQHEGSSRLEVRTEPWGHLEVDYRDSYATTSVEDVRESLSAWVEGSFLAEELDELEFSPPSDLDEPFRVRIRIDEASRGFTALGDAMVAIRYEGLLESFPDALLEDDQEERQGDFVFPMPFQVTWHYRAVPTPGFVPADLPENRVTELGTARLEEVFSLAEDGAIEAVIHLDSGPRRISAEQFEESRKALVDLAERGYTPLYFVHQGQRLLEQGKTAEGLAELARLTELEPEVALHQVRLARCLVGVGLGEEAREAARSAVSIDGESLAAYNALAWVLQHDLVGRKHGPGFDREGALAAYRKACELEDADLAVWINLAILLEHDSNGRRYSPDADLDGAIAQYRAAQEAFPEDFVYGHNVLVAMLWDRRFDEIVELNPDLGDSFKENVIILTAIAATDSVGEAHRRVRLEYRSADGARSVLLEIARLLGQQRFYAEGAAAYRLAAQGAEDAPGVLGRALLLDRSRRIEELEYDPTTPGGVIKKAYALAGDLDGDERIRAEILSRVIQDHYDDEALEQAGLHLARTMQQVSRGLKLPPKMLIDLTIGGTDWIVEGARSTVRKVHLRSVTGESQHDVVAFVIEEDGAYRLLALENDISVLGVVARDLLEKGNEAGAREVLDWARDLVFSYDSGDPLDGSPFARIWRRGEEADAAAIRHAALSLAADGPMGSTVRPDLERALENGGGGEWRSALQQALIGVYRSTESFERLAEVAAELEEVHASSWFPLSTRIGALIQLERYDEAIACAEAHLERRPGDVMALRLLASAVEATGDIERAVKLADKVVASSEAMSMDFNNLAWLALFRDQEIDDRALLWASSGVKRASGGAAEFAALHTLATLYAEKNMPAEAYQVIVKAMNPEKEPQPVEWIVFGRMAETYGFLDAARSAYQRVIDGAEETQPISTAALARMWLARMAREASRDEPA